MASRLSVIDVERCVGCQSCMFACARRAGTGGLEGSRIQVRSAGGIRRGFTVIVCRACGDPPCASVCPTGALSRREGGGVRLATTLCIGCGGCVGACSFEAIAWDARVHKPLVCTYCGYCARYCPYEVIAHVRAT